MNQTLHFQSDQIDQVFAGRGVPSRVTGGTVTPRLVRFQIATPSGVKARQLSGLSEEIALSLGASSCRVYRQEGHRLGSGTPQVQVEVPRSDAPAVPLLTLCRRLVTEGPRGCDTVPPVTAVLGLDHGGVPMLLRFPSPNVNHVLIAGTTGSGKTSLARTIVTSLALFNSQRNLQLVLIDSQGRGFVPFEGLPHLLLPVVTRADESLPVLQRLVDEMERRDLQGRAEPRLQGTASAAVVVVLDDLADLVQVGGREIESLLTRLTRQGHRDGVHVVACTQKPTAAVIRDLVKNGFPVRLVGNVASTEDAQIATGLPRTGAEQLLGQGDFLIVAKGQVTRMQAAYIEIAEAQDQAKQLAERTRSLFKTAAGSDSEKSNVVDLARTLRSPKGCRAYTASAAVSRRWPRLQLVK